MATVDVDEINKIRKAVGLPLLPSATAPQPDGPSFKEHSDSDDSEGEPASTLETREAAGYENYRQKQEEERKRIERERRKQQIQRARDAAARFTKLEGKGLGDSEDAGDLDAKAWLKGSKKRQARIDKERAQKLATELAEREKLEAIEYTSADLAGVKVAHEVGDFEDGEGEQILTLKDAQVLQDDDEEDDEDMLENAEIVARDKLKDKLDLKKKKAYDVHDADEEDDKGLLSQYDDKKRKAFTLDNLGSPSERRDAKRQQLGEKIRSTISLDMLKPEPVSDYMEIKIKKPKKSKKSSKRQRADDDDEDIFSTRNGSAADAMDLDKAEVASAPRPKHSQSAFNDDEDLASALSFTRRTALKKQKRKAEDIVKQLREEEEDTAKSTPEQDGGFTLDETTNFLDNLSNQPQEEERVQRKAPSPAEPVPTQAPSAAEGQDEPMGEAYGGIDNEEELLEQIKQSEAKPEASHSALGEEETLDQGLGAALSLLRKRGVVKPTDVMDKNSLYKSRQDFMIEARLREHDNEQKARTQRERDRQSGKLNNMSAKEREDHARWQNTQREHQSSIAAAAAFNRDYKPDVQIKYVDENGRLMNQKEAFKHLSHQFHGKGSGKQKTEKHLKKLEEEKKRMATSVLDSSKATGMNNAAGTQSKKNKEAGVRLA